MNSESVKSLNPYNQKNMHFNQLDGLRCIAVMSVLICHWVTYNFVVLIPLGSMGVNLFFVLSGFLISRILFLSKEENYNKSLWVPIKNFYIRRTLRIFPVYYILIGFLFLFNFPAVRNNIVWLLTYTFNIKFGLPGVWESNELNVLVHLWSLSVEEQFYLFFPFLILLIPQRKIKAFLFFVIIAAVVSRLILILIDAPPNSVYVFTSTCFDAFGIGALLAYYLLYEPELLKKIVSKNYLLAFFAVVYVCSIIYSRKYIENYGECRTILERFLFSVACFWLVGKAVFSSYTGRFKRFLERPSVIYIGKISYGLYLYHHFAQFFFRSIGSPYYKFRDATNNDMLASVLLYFIATMIVASLSWHFIENPINRLKLKFK